MLFEINNYYKFDEYTCRVLNEEDSFAIQTLCEKSSDYFLLDQDENPSKVAGKEILESLPPQKELDDKYVIGFFNIKDELVAIIDLIKNYPGECEWTLGLLLIDPRERRRGLGVDIHDGLVNWIKKQNGIKIRIGVLDNNINAIRFWSKVGYELTKKSLLERECKENRNILVMIILSNTFSLKGSQMRFSI